MKIQAVRFSSTSLYENNTKPRDIPEGINVHRREKHKYLYIT
jgi:hypothetical protein